ncbi:MAG: rhodanese-like domain-containing protein [Bacteroidota bacterium]
MEISVKELKAKLDQGETPFLLDVREPFEYQKASLGGHCIPMNLIPARISELDSSNEIIVFCHHGGRSQVVVRYLREHGFKNVKNLTGGIDAWSVKIDQGIKRY